MTHGSLFSGIGGFDLAARWCGWENVFQVEKDAFCRKVLARHFPEAARYEDIYDFDGTQYRGQIDVISGGFPCQPFSVAGKRKGTEDDRHLWPEMLRVIAEIRPRFVLGENVAGIVNMELDNVLSSLEAEGYETQALIIPACAVGAPHRRDRVWIIARSNADDSESGRRDIRIGKHKRKIKGEINTRKRKMGSDIAINGDKIRSNASAYDSENKYNASNSPRPNDGRNRGEPEERQISESGSGAVEINDPDSGDAGLAGSERRGSFRQGTSASGSIAELREGAWHEHWLEAATRLCVVDDGLPGGLARPKGWRVNALKAAGNAIVPQVAYEIFSAINTYDKY